MQIIKLTFTFFPYVLRYNSVPVQLCFVNLRYLHLKNTTVIHVFRKITSNANMNLNMKYIFNYVPKSFPYLKIDFNKTKVRWIKRPNKTKFISVILSV